MHGCTKEGFYHWLQVSPLATYMYMQGTTAAIPIPVYLQCRTYELCRGGVQATFGEYDDQEFTDSLSLLLEQ